MIKIANVLRIVTLLFFLGCSQSHAFADGCLALGARASTLGAGLEVTARITSTINTRIGINALQYTYTGRESDIKYDIDLSLLSQSLLLDWHPLGGAFRLSAGALRNQNSVDLESVPEATVSYKIGNRIYTQADVGKLKGSIDFAPLAPYAGIGFGNAVGRNGHWHFSLDLGAVYQGSPEVELDAIGPIALIPQFQQELQREREDLEDEIDHYRYYPVVALGLSYRF